MMTTIEKVRRLEKYLGSCSSEVDPVIEMAVNKLLSREFERVRQLTKRLSKQLMKFEEQYALQSAEFHKRYEHGEMGDSMDFVEWSATVEMLGNAKKQMAFLEPEIEQ